MLRYQEDFASEEKPRGLLRILAPGLSAIAWGYGLLLSMVFLVQLLPEPWTRSHGGVDSLTALLATPEWWGLPPWLPWAGRKILVLAALGLVFLLVQRFFHRYANHCLRDDALRSFQTYLRAAAGCWKPLLEPGERLGVGVEVDAPAGRAGCGLGGPFHLLLFFGLFSASPFLLSPLESGCLGLGETLLLLGGLAGATWLTWGVLWALGLRESWLWSALALTLVLGTTVCAASPLARGIALVLLLIHLALSVRLFGKIFTHRVLLVSDRRLLWFEFSQDQVLEARSYPLPTRLTLAPGDREADWLLEFPGGGSLRVSPHLADESLLVDFLGEIEHPLEVVPGPRRRSLRQDLVGYGPAALGLFLVWTAYALVAAGLGPLPSRAEVLLEALGETPSLQQDGRWGEALERLHLLTPEDPFLPLLEARLALSVPNVERARRLLTELDSPSSIASRQRRLRRRDRYDFQERREQLEGLTQTAEDFRAALEGSPESLRSSSYLAGLLQILVTSRDQRHSYRYRGPPDPDERGLELLEAAAREDPTPRIHLALLELRRLVTRHREPEEGESAREHLLQRLAELDRIREPLAPLAHHPHWGPVAGELLRLRPNLERDLLRALREADGSEEPLAPRIRAQALETGPVLLDSVQSDSSGLWLLAPLGSPGEVLDLLAPWTSHHAPQLQVAPGHSAALPWEKILGQSPEERRERLEDLARRNGLSPTEESSDPPLSAGLRMLLGAP